MKKTIYTIALFIIAFSSRAQLTIQPGAQFKTTGNVQLVLKNTNLVNNSVNTDFSNAVLVLNGNNNTVLSGSGNWQVKQLKVYKGAGNAMLGANIQVSDKVQFVSGNLDLNNQTLTLGTNAYLQDENENSRITGPNGGIVQTTSSMNAPNAINPGNLGAIITSNANLGTVTIRRLHKTSNESNKVKRFYEITPSNNSTLNAILRLHYFNAELNGINESALIILQRPSSNASWTQLGYTNRNSNTNFVEKTGINSFYQYALVPAATSVLSTRQMATDAKGPADFTASLAPVPAHSFTTLSLTVPVAGNAGIFIVTAEGKTALHLSKELGAGANNISLDLNRFAAGTYFVQVQLPGGLSKTLPLIKQ